MTQNKSQPSRRLRACSLGKEAQNASTMSITGNIGIWLLAKENKVFETKYSLSLANINHLLCSPSSRPRCASAVSTQSTVPSRARAAAGPCVRRSARTSADSTPQSATRCPDAGSLLMHWQWFVPKVAWFKLRAHAAFWPSSSELICLLVASLCQLG